MTTLAEQLQAATGDRYTIERELGRGGMATVLLARDIRHGRAVAIKVLRPDVAAHLGAERFLREIHIAAGLSHPHILPLHDSGAAEGLLFYVMPFVEGESLRDRLRRDGVLPVAEAVRLVREVADALEYAHQHGVIHRDIKPENILLSSGHAVVADFGIARAVNAAADSQITEVGAAVGSPRYMSPEQVAGDAELDARSDVYSLGCVLFEAVTGRPPFPGMLSRLVETAPSLRTVQAGASAAIEAVVSRALARDRALRFSSAAEFSAALTRLESNAAAPAVARQERTSIAVLPFANLSREADSEYFSDGMTDELMGALARVPQLRVVARSSSYAFKGKETDVREIGRALGVGVAMEGSVRKAGNRIRLNVQLVNTESGYHIWSETYDRDLGDVFALQGELARTICGALRLQLPGSEPVRTPVPGTKNLEAYTLYLRGRYQSHLRTMDGLTRAIEYLDQAIAADPEYALAYAQLAECWAYRSFPEFGDLPPHEGMPQARAMAERALALDPASGEAHTVLGIVQVLYDWSWERAEAELQRATELTPEYSIIYVWLGILRSIQLRFDEGLDAAKRALALEPLSLSIQTLVARCCCWSGRYEDGLRYVQGVTDVDPRNFLAHIWRGRILRLMGRVEEASNGLEALVATFGRDYRLVSDLGICYALAGQRDRAAAVATELSEEHHSPYHVCSVRAAVGDLDLALADLERAIEARSGMVAFMGITDTDLRGLREHPRFQAHLRDLGLQAAPHAGPLSLP